MQVICKNEMHITIRFSYVLFQLNELFVVNTELHDMSKVYAAYVGPTWGRQDPGGPHVGPMILDIWVYLS